MTSAPSARLRDINLNDPTLFMQEEAHDIFRIMRREAPIHWTEPGENSNGFWSLTKYDDIVYVSRNPELFISSKGIAGPGLKPEAAAAQQAQNPGAAAGAGNVSIITMDPPRHVKMRRVVNKGFTPRAVNAMEGQIREICNNILDTVDGKPTFDFVTEVASQLPLAVICGMMGLEKQDWPLMFQLTNKVLGAGDPEYQTDVPEEKRGTGEAARTTGMMGFMGMLEFFRSKLEDRRKHRREDDLVSILLDAEVDGDPLTEGDVLAFCFLLVVAGNETTRNGISGGLKALCDHPAEKARLLADMTLIETAVDEMIRWVSPLHHMSREATGEAVIRGQKISAGDRIMMWYPSANRDEDYFDDPYRFNITRSPNDHIAFGIGEHFCLGAGFARKEIRVMFEEVLRRFPSIELDGTPERLRSNFINGVKHMPVRV